MTQIRLEEILSKDNVSNEELGEILGDLFISFSKHFKDIKIQMNNLSEEIGDLKKEIQASNQAELAINYGNWTLERVKLTELLKTKRYMMQHHNNKLELHNGESNELNYWMNT